MKETINDKTLKELEDLFEKKSYKKFRARQVYRQIHINKVNDFDAITDLPKDMRFDLSKDFKFAKVEKIKEYKSGIDRTKKYLFELEDKNIIEAVFMDYNKRKTICISSQVGCRMGCSFCASTKNGLKRNLTSAELVEEVYSLERENGDINNIVIMGIGEPLDNYNNIVKFIKIITDEKGRNLSHRSITLSTSGLVPRIYDLADSKLDVNLAISLHYAFDYKRREYMPVAKKYSLENLIKASDYYLEKTKRRVSMEYVLIDGVNNTKEDIDQLCRLFKGKNIHINLIPLNPIEEFKHEKTKKALINKFQVALEKRGLNATVRQAMGSDINAACGQLRNNYAR
ncbi:MAG: 23S rRNA (adenine(2503)-C(2))-methyltransferase RlmN [Peptoniphilaceae bacterium]|nr:23S rRNA (adenine(2503)-C(2))-methyltransferase RlmN [Peptoniphilaceae bacterium]